MDEDKALNPLLCDLNNKTLHHRTATPQVREVGVSTVGVPSSTPVQEVREVAGILFSLFISPSHLVHLPVFAGSKSSGGREAPLYKWRGGKALGGRAGGNITGRNSYFTGN